MHDIAYPPDACRDPRAAAVLRHWFGDPTRYGRGDPRWFRKDPAFDDDLRVRFGDLVREALAGGLVLWETRMPDALALLVVLDQFPRNLFRPGMPEAARAFAGDARARALARQLLAAGADRDRRSVERLFMYLPFEHSETLEDQDRSVELFRALDGDPEVPQLLDYAERHREVIRRFGRFPHRNAALGRASTPEEEAYLSVPGAGF